ncbi:MAG: Na/Pi symporter, partial [Gammaproteobacteria bacterium]
MGQHFDIVNIAIPALGGLGLFLLGMVLLTDGLRALAGDAIRANLVRFTRTPLSGALTGALTTTALQSSSATTVAAVGFVGAGLMPFANALGIIFGANIGSTATGWLVALIGFKLSLSTLALPLVFAGALARLFARGRLAHGGLALAGFALIFIGIEHMQGAMRALEPMFSFDALPATGIGDRLALVALGIGFTVCTQASSAAVATALTALNAGLLGFEQAACIVIGADIGTTVTAALATLGATLDARRTGYSHVIYNVCTGCMAFLLVDLYAWLVATFAPALRAHDPELMLVGFHTGFNVLGVVLVLPFAQSFARAIERLVGPREDEQLAGLDRRLLSQPTLALDALGRAVEQAYRSLLGELARQLGVAGAGTPLDLARMQRLLDELQDFAGDIDLRATHGGEWQRLLALLHALDHLQRLHERLDEEPLRARTARTSDGLVDERRAAQAALAEIVAALAHTRPDLARAASAALHERLGSAVQPFRDRVAQAMAARTLSVEAGTEELEGVRWLRRVGRHVARIAHHLEAAAHA